MPQKKLRPKTPEPEKKPELEAGTAPKLLDLQLENAKEQRYPWIVLITGSACSGRGQTVNDLSEWLDTRHVRTLAWGPRESTEKDRPWLHRYWHDLPARGTGAFVFGGWYDELFAALHEKGGNVHKHKIERALEEAHRFEQLFVREGGLLLKVHLDLDRKVQKKRVAKYLEDPKERWRVQPEDEAELEHAKAYQKTRDALVDATSWPESPWHVVDATDEKARSEAVAMAVLDAFVAKQKETSAKPPEAKKPTTLRSTVEGTPRLSTEPTLVALEKTEYKQRLPKLHYRLGELQRDPRLAKRGLVVAFEGPDASGKGGAIRRVTRGLDARFYRVVPIAAPTELEKSHPYLWRFWEMIPPRGKMTFFDRSWYGRVLVERVEGFATEAEWERAYDEIVGFERELSDAGYVVAKFWLHTSKEEQLARFEARQGNRYKNYKLTDDDLRNRKKWDDYQLAASDMITRTDSKHAPWHVIAGDDKQHARIAVLEAIIAALERAID